MVRYTIKVSSTVVDHFDSAEDALKKFSFLKELGLDAKVFKEELEWKEDPVVLDKTLKVVKSEQLF